MGLQIYTPLLHRPLIYPFIYRSLSALPYQCGLTRLERDRVEAAVSFSAQLTWHELSFAALLTARTLDECARLRHRVEVKITNRWDAPPPPAWPDDIGSHIGEPRETAHIVHPPPSPEPSPNPH